jgi:hypothetical protein
MLKIASKDMKKEDLTGPTLIYDNKHSAKWGLVAHTEIPATQR